MKIGCVLLAAGAGKRFGGGKLLHEIENEPMIQRALRLFSQVPFAARVLVTRAEAEEIQQYAREAGVATVINPNPERGVGSSVSVATQAILASEPQLDGILYAVADQPYLTNGSVEKLLAAFAANPDHIVSLSFAGKRGNPAIFPSGFFSELSALWEDIGGGAVIKRYPERLMLVEAGSARELQDIDTKENN